jgi:hypothetical protein
LHLFLLPPYVLYTSPKSVLVSSPTWGSRPDFCYCQLRVCFVGCPLWREDRSVVCNCCWPSPARSFSGPVSDSRLSQLGGPGPHIYIPQEQGAQLYPQAMVPLLSPPATRRVTVQAFGLVLARAYLSRLILPVLTTRPMFGLGYKSWSSLLGMCDFLYFRS